MSWRDRVVEAAYTSPSGVRTVFAWESVSRTTPKRVAVFDFPLVNDSYAQDNGHGSRRYPILAYFNGDNCDLEATSFEVALLERGRGRIEHPFYGTFNVVPFGEVGRRDDLKEAANQAVVETTFMTSTDLYPSSQSNPRNELAAALVAYNAAVAQQFTATTSLGTVAARANTVAAARSMISKTTGALADVADATTAVARAYAELERAILLSLDTLIGEPVALAAKLVELVQLPAQSAAAILARLDAYASLAQSILASPAGKPNIALAAGAVLPRRNVKVGNDFHVADLFASSAVSGSIHSVMATKFTTRPAAIDAAATVLEQLDALVAWRDGAFVSLAQLGQLDTGETYRALHHAASLTAGYLVDVSFSLVAERSIVLDRPRTIIDLSAQLYGAVDSRLDFLIQTNDLSGSEILELPPGRRIVYYP